MLREEGGTIGGMVGADVGPATTHRESGEAVQGFTTLRATPVLRALEALDCNWRMGDVDEWFADCPLCRRRFVLRVWSEDDGQDWDVDGPEVRVRCSRRCDWLELRRLLSVDWDVLVWRRRAEVWEAHAWWLLDLWRRTVSL